VHNAPWVRSVNERSGGGKTAEGRIVLLGGDPTFRQQIDWSRVDQQLAKLIAQALPTLAP
jgi:hypothetical protein